MKPSTKALILVLATCLTGFQGLATATPRAATASSPSPGAGKVFLTLDEALKLAFPECTIERTVVYLTKEQHKEAEKLAALEIDDKIVHPYAARNEKGELVGWAYFDTHRVRTLGETIMIVVDPEERVQRIEVLAFGEPEDYIPKGAWYGQFKGKRLGPELSLKRDIRGVTGATLTARATTDAVRRVLAAHRVGVVPPAGKLAP